MVTDGVTQEEEREPARFPTTQWSLIVTVREGDPEQKREALSQICQKYWRPLYVFVRAQGSGHEDAEDSVQAFFGMLLRREDFCKPDGDTGKLRNFLMVSLKHFLINEARHRQAQRRFGGETDIQIDGLRLPPEQLYSELRTEETPESRYYREWAVGLLEHATARLAADYESQGKGALFRALTPFLQGDAERGQAYRDAAVALGMKEGAVRVAAFRLRRRQRELIKEEILATLDSPEAYEEERQFILRALATAV